MINNPNRRVIKVPTGSVHDTREKGTKIACCGGCGAWTTNYLVMDLGPYVDDETIAQGLDARKGLFLCNADAQRYSEWLQNQLAIGDTKEVRDYSPYLRRWLLEVKGRSVD